MRTARTLAFFLAVTTIALGAHAQGDDLPPPTSSSSSTSSTSAGASIRVEGGVGVGASSTSGSVVGATPEPARDPRDLRVSDTTSSGAPERPVDPGSERLLQGFRLGYSYVANSTVPSATFNGQSIADRVGMRTPSSFLIGYEAFYRMASHSWLNVILVGNVLVGGLEQSKFFPTANALLGFEFNNSFQVGVGINVVPLKESYAHTVFAAGWTPRVGAFYVPIHFFFVPDVDGYHRMGVTTGVTW
jgi:hypothetical protein